MSKNITFFRVFLTICHFLLINHLKDNIFIRNLEEMFSVVYIMKQKCSFYSNTDLKVVKSEKLIIFLSLFITLFQSCISGY